MHGTVIELLYWAVYLCGWLAVLASSDAARGPRARPGPWGIGLWCAVALPSLLQFLVSALLAGGKRDVGAIESGQWWRLGTAMFLQDGGWVGTAFNLFTLAVSVVIVSRAVPGPVVVAVFLVGGLVSNLLAALVLGQSGAGNSMATMFLVTSTAVVTWARGGRDRRAGLALVGLVAVCATLLARGDQHGFATAAGLLAGIGGALVWRRPAD